jgi:uncharacterized protein (DUF1778 family)
MPIKTRQAAKRNTLNVRIGQNERNLIDSAARLTGKTRTDFVLDAARRAAEEALLDQVYFGVSQDAYDEFLARLDAPPRPNERLKRALRKPPVWS